ncbi:MAG: AI-2E family transporter [Alphaproteobacteria bacterium]|nr:AI-2E family transporter [Alphaproteobacteria bacterium]MCB9974371.1 AI-2E family transporter [Rhodospirillales bacterium]
MAYKPLKPATHLIFWTSAAVFFLLVAFVLRSALLPFVLGAAVAYLLNPLVNLLGKEGLSRRYASLMIVGVFMIVLTLLALVTIPVLVREITELAKNIPDYLRGLEETLRPLIQKVEAALGVTHDEAVENIVRNGGGPAVQTLNVIAKNLLSGGQAVLDALSILFIMPVVAYFLMKDWPSVTQWIQDLIPRHAKDVADRLLTEIDGKISGFVRGQITVALSLGIAYALLLTLAGLKYGALIGLGSGFLSIIPMVGSAVGLIVSLAVAWFQTANFAFVLLIAAIFVGGQVIEGNVLTPKFVGDSVGLHPLWIFFALMAGGSLLGILGMFLAVPVTAVIGVVSGYLLEQYKDSRYYNDLEPERGSGETKRKTSRKTGTAKKTAAGKTKNEAAEKK